MMIPPLHTHTHHKSGPLSAPQMPPIHLSPATPLFYHSTLFCISQPPNLQKWLQCLTSTPPTRTTFNPTLGRFPQDHHRHPPPAFQPLCLYPSLLSPSAPALVPTSPTLHTLLLPQAPDPICPLTTSLSSLSWCALASLLSPALPGAAVVPFLPEKGPQGTGMCRE